MKSAPCPRPEQLRALVQGTVPEVEQTKLAQYLEGCRDCQQRLEKLARGMVAWLKQTQAHGNPPDSPHLQRLIERLKAGDQPQ